MGKKKEDKMIKKASFLLSVADISQLPKDKTEIAVAGKSNVGKSTFINFICDNRKLARVAKEPGRTRMLNYFDINDGQFTFVDLPGYGYAKVSKAEKQKWANLLEQYFQLSKGLKHTILILDIRHNPTDDDLQMLKYMYYYNIPFTIVATKSDKLSASATNRRKNEISQAVGVGLENIITISSTKKQGKEQVINRLKQVLAN